MLRIGQVRALSLTSRPLSSWANERYPVSVLLPILIGPSILLYPNYWIDHLQEENAACLRSSVVTMLFRSRTVVQGTAARTPSQSIRQRSPTSPYIQWASDQPCTSVIWSFHACQTDSQLSGQVYTSVATDQQAPRISQPPWQFLVLTLLLV